MSASTLGAAIARPLRRAQLAENAMDARSLVAEDARRARQSRRGWRWAAIGCGAGWFASTVAIVLMMPLLRVVPVMVTLRADGGWDDSVSWSAVPANQQERVITTLLWQYVRLREGYSSGEANYAWDVVSTMSTKPVKDQFQAWYDRSNPQSPQRTIGQRGTVRAVRLGEPARLSSDTVRIDFNRIETINGREGRPVRHTVTLRYRIADRIPSSQVTSYNPAGVIVWEYPGATQVTAGASE